MRTLVSLTLALLVSTCAWAQRGGMHGGFGGGARMGGGAHMGGGGAHMGGGGVRVGVGGFRGGFVGGPFHGGGFGAFHGFRGGFVGSGFHNRGFHHGFQNGFGFGLGFGSFGYWPYGAYWGGYPYGYGGYPYGYGYYDPMFSSYYNPCPSYVANYDCGYPSYSTISAYQPQTAAQPAVVINQPIAPATPVITEYPDNSSYGGGTSTAPERQPAATRRSRSALATDQSPIYLIAFKDHVIRPALAYSVKGETLHYVGLDHRDKQVPMSSVDRAFSEQLNSERNVPFRLPG